MDTVRNTKVYSVTMPPEMAKQAEALAKKESRTMSELMREAFRRYQREEQDRQLAADPVRAKRLLQLKQMVAQLRQEAVKTGASKLTMRQLDAEVQAYRRGKQDKQTRENKQPVR